jgi:hypothetical protein
MRKTYKNRIFEIIKESGLSPEEFQLDEGEEKVLESIHNLTTITHKKTNTLFKILTNSQDYEELTCSYTKYSPSKSLSEYEIEYGYDMNNPDIIIWNPAAPIYMAFVHWLNNDLHSFIEDKSEPDLWAEFKKEVFMDSSSTGEMELVGFTGKEQDKITIVLLNIKKQIISQYCPDESTENYIEDRFNHISKSLDKLTRFDFNALLFYTIHGIVLNLTLNPEGARNLLDLVKIGLGPVKQILLGQ